MQEIFVFGSNTAGRHGKGAAKVAWMHHGAVRGQGLGHHGSSYAIPTKNADLSTLPLRTVQSYVDIFTVYAQVRQDLRFMVTAVGCGLAGFEPRQVAPLFCRCVGLPNVYLPAQFSELLPGSTRVSFDYNNQKVVSL